jgi:hypothetical protein
MIRSVLSPLWAFDLEWAPDPQAGRVLYPLPADLSDVDAVGEMWRRGGATEEKPTPFLKMIQCRVVSIAAVQRTASRDGAPDLKLLWLPRDTADPEQIVEAAMIGKFLEAIGRHKPQLVGFNSSSSDLRILIQRAVVHGLSAPAFCERPNKPWEGPDYFARDNERHLDLLDVLAGWGRGDQRPSLHEAAVLSGIPGKFDAEGEQVAQLWLTGHHRQIVEYNCFDALTTYLLWLRVAHFAGHFSRAQYEDEQGLLKDLLLEMTEQPETAFLERYLDEWERLQTVTGQ